MAERLFPPIPDNPAPRPDERPRPLEDVGRWQRFDQTLAEARAGFADLPPEARQALVDEATAVVRGELPTPDAPEADMASPDS